MNIIEKYWEWDESLNDTNIKLGNEIKSLVLKRIITQDEKDFTKYKVCKGRGLYSHIKVIDEKIKYIYFKNSFFFINESDIWNMEYESFILSIEEKLKPVNKNYVGDILYVVFREFYPAPAAARILSCGVIDNNKVMHAKLLKT